MRDERKPRSDRDRPLGQPLDRLDVLVPGGRVVRIARVGRDVIARTRDHDLRHDVYGHALRRCGGRRSRTPGERTACLGPSALLPLWDHALAELVLIHVVVELHGVTRALAVVAREAPLVATDLVLHLARRW